MVFARKERAFFLLFGNSISIFLRLRNHAFLEGLGSGLSPSELQCEVLLRHFRFLRGVKLRSCGLELEDEVFRFDCGFERWIFTCGVFLLIGSGDGWESGTKTLIYGDFCRRSLRPGICFYGCLWGVFRRFVRTYLAVCGWIGFSGWCRGPGFEVSGEFPAVVGRDGWEMGGMRVLGFRSCAAACLCLCLTRMERGKGIGRTWERHV